MAIDPRFHEPIRARLEELFGPEHAEVLMAEFTSPSTDFETRTDAALAYLTSRADQTDAAVRDLTARMDRMEGRFDHLESRFDQMDTRVAGLESSGERTNAGLDRINGRLDDLYGRMAQVLMWVVGTVVLGLVGVALAATTIG